MGLHRTTFLPKGEGVDDRVTSPIHKHNIVCLHTRMYPNTLCGRDESLSKIKMLQQNPLPNHETYVN